MRSGTPHDMPGRFLKVRSRSCFQAIRYSDFCKIQKHVEEIISAPKRIACTKSNTHSYVEVRAVVLGRESEKLLPVHRAGRLLRGLQAPIAVPCKPEGHVKYRFVFVNSVKQIQENPLLDRLRFTRCTNSYARKPSVAICDKSFGGAVPKTFRPLLNTTGKVRLTEDFNLKTVRQGL